MATTRQIADYTTTDFPQCNSSIASTGNQTAAERHKIGHDERPVAHAVATYSIPPAAR